MPTILRWLLGFVVGLGATTLLTEVIEYGLVSLAGGSATDPQQYFAVRNRSWILGLKLFYTPAAGLLGGYLAAWIGGRSGLRLALAVALAQALSLIWAMTASPFAGSTPLWLWITLLITVPAAIGLGGWLRMRSKKPE